MNFSLAIYCSPHDAKKSETAFHFAREIISAGHEIYRIFFFSDGVLNAANNSPLSLRWQEFITAENIDVIVCVASAKKHGIKHVSSEATTKATTKAIKKNEAELLTGFEIGGLGQLIDANIHSDRIITFGN